MIETVFRLLKLTVIIAICAIFMVAINGLLNLITNVLFGGVISEFIHLISMYLPFNASVIFGAIATSITGILAFLIAKKIFDLTSWGVNSV